MLRSLLLPFLIGLSVSTAGAADPTFRKNLTIDAVDDAFQDVAEKLDLPDFWIRKEECRAAVKAVCNYTLEGKLALTAVADAPQGPAESLTLIFGSGSEPMSMLASIGLLVDVTQPGLTPNGRSRVVKALLDDLADTTKVETTTKKVRYKRNNSEIGLFVTAEPR
ncbi:hypothetical protein [Aureimonas leprariae]|uniref:Uncharacterized protein n=1 Tax=Plantimonas leprariae TaxID=2615207 RepID=A0A7V7PNC4_9HYPH|nr:hypothetical protein [Aureimonas leprariae]KAB0679232.1 hypothetical protein F6X38_12875 [Aureimonas leprariae]